MSKKSSSILIIFAIYLIATWIGILSFQIFSIDSLVIRVLVSNVIATFFIYLVGIGLKNASLYDPYWSIQPPVILLILMIYLKIELSYVLFLTFTGILLWSFRLTYNWAKNWTGFHEEDWRYQMIRSKAPRIYLLSNLFGIHMMPTIIVYIQLIGIISVMNQKASSPLLSGLGFIMILIAVTIQYISDDQMYKFKKMNKGMKKCIKEGLWKYSRHPNYFGEILVWWGLYTIYISISNTLDLNILAPILMTSLFVFISIPMMEKKILSTRPEYENYQKEVSMLIPLPFIFHREEEKNA